MSELEPCYDGATCVLTYCEICGGRIHLDEPSDIPICEECYGEPGMEFEL